MEKVKHLHVRYACGPCGLEHIEVQDPKSKFIEKKELWHVCSDNYDVPLQAHVERHVEGKTDK